MWPETSHGHSGSVLPWLDSPTPLQIILEQCWTSRHLSVTIPASPSFFTSGFNSFRSSKAYIGPNCPPLPAWLQDPNHSIFTEPPTSVSFPTPRYLSPGLC